MHWLRAHRLLLVVYGAGLALVFLEWTVAGIQSGRPEDPRVYLAPDSNIADVSAALYPDRALTYYYRAQQAALCSDPSARSQPVCRARGPVRPGEVRELLERAIATGNRSEELIAYNYAMVLLQEGAPEAEVEAAVRRWRIDHPSSQRPDPRVAWQELRRP